MSITLRYSILLSSSSGEIARLQGAITEEAAVADSSARLIEVARALSEAAAIADSADGLLLVDLVDETASIGDSIFADEMIRQKIRFPNLQGRHVSLKFTSVGAGTFALYFIRHKMFRTVAPANPYHPNLQGRHLSLLLEKSEAEAFDLHFISQKVLKTVALADQQHPNTQGKHISLSVSHKADEAFSLHYASAKLHQVAT